MRCLKITIDLRGTMSFNNRLQEDGYVSMATLRCQAVTFCANSFDSGLTISLDFFQGV